MNIAYLIQQAERQPSAAERRAADIRRGELASGLARLLRRDPARRVTVCQPPSARDVRCPQAVSLPNWHGPGLALSVAPVRVGG